MSDTEQFRAFLLDNLEYLKLEGSTGYNAAATPDFDLTAYEYLEFAEQQLDDYLREGAGDPSHLINCVSNLKRAADCQLDTFLYTFNLLELSKKNNLKFETKLKFLSDASVFNSRSLSRLNRIRNKMEHEYQVPHIDDIEAYHDLVAAFVAVLDRTRYIVTSYELLYRIRGVDAAGEGDGFFSLEYDFDNPSIKATWRLDDKETSTVVTPDNIADFTFFFRSWVLLVYASGSASLDYVRSRLELPEA